MYSGRTTRVATTTNPSGSFVWQPVMMGPILNTIQQLNYPHMKVTSIRIVSAACTTLGIASIGVQIATLVIYLTWLLNYVVSDLDVVAHGIWAGLLYLTAGSLGITASKKRTKSHVVWAAVLSAFSIAASVAAAALSGITAAHGVYSYCYYYPTAPSSLCDSWTYLEWTLMTISILALFSALTLLILMLLVLCGKRKDIVNAEFDITQSDNGQKPVSFTPQSISQLRVRQPEPGFQLVYVSQQLQPDLFQTPIVAPVVQSQQQPSRRDATDIQIELNQRLTNKPKKIQSH